MKVTMTNQMMMEFFGALSGILGQETLNNRRFNYAVDRNMSLLRGPVMRLRVRDAENLKEYYKEADAEQKLAIEQKRKPDPQWMARLRERYKADFEKNKAMMLEKQDFDLYRIEFSWLPEMPAFASKALAPVLTKPTAEDMGQDLIDDPTVAELDKNVMAGVGGEGSMAVKPKLEILKKD